MGVTKLARSPRSRRFHAHLRNLGRPARVALVNFDIAITRKDYDANFYATLRWLVTEPRTSSSWSIRTGRLPRCCRRTTRSQPWI